MGVVTAFLQEEVEENILIKIPDGVVGVDRITSICKLEKMLFGPKQAPERWNLKMDNFLESFGSSTNSGGPCLYVKRGENGKCMTIALYVDDKRIWQGHSK